VDQLHGDHRFAHNLEWAHRARCGAYRFWKPCGGERKRRDPWKVTDPNNWSVSPAFRANLTVTLLSRAACCSAAPFSVAVRLESVMRIFSRRLNVCGRSLEGEFMRQQIVARIARGNFHYLASRAELFDVFLKDNLHGVLVFFVSMFNILSNFAVLLASANQDFNTEGTENTVKATESGRLSGRL